MVIENVVSPDEMKAEFIAFCIEAYKMKLGVSGAKVAEYFEDTGLLDFLLLLEETRVAVYAPEIRPLVKCSEKILAQAWQDLKLK